MSNHNKKIVQKSLDNSNKNTVVQRIKAIVNTLWGTKKDILTSFTISLFVMSIIFLVIANQFPNSKESIFFYVLFAIHFALWLILTIGADNTEILSYELAILAGSLILFYKSLSYLARFSFDTATKGWPALMFLCLSSLCFSLFHFASRLKIVLASVKKTFSDFSDKISSSTSTRIAKTTDLLEKITSLLVAITALMVAIKGIDAFFEAVPYLINIAGKSN